MPPQCANPVFDTFAALRGASRAKGRAMSLIQTKHSLHGKLGGAPVQVEYSTWTKTPNAPGVIDNAIYPANTLHVKLDNAEHDISGGDIAATVWPVGALVCSSSVRASGASARTSGWV